MKSMRVLHVVAGMDPKMGGVSKAVRMIITGLNEFNINNETVSLDPPDAHYLKADPFPIHAVGIGKTPWAYNSQLFSWLQDNLERFDVVIVHGLWLYTSHAVKKAVLSFKKRNKKTPKFFVMPHGMLDPYFQRASGRKLKAIRNWIFWKLIERKVVNHADGLLFTCEMEQVLARKTFVPYKPKKELVVGLGVEAPPKFTKVMEEEFLRKTGLKSNDRYLLSISRIHEKKGVDLLISAYLNLKQSHVELPVLVIAGPGLETEYGQKIQLLASKSSDIRFLGMLTGDVKWGAFYGCEAFVLPSHQENFGIAVVEALACGKPVLISDQINIWKEIVDSGSGLVAEDTESKIQEMLGNWPQLPDDKKKLMGVKARSCYEKYFDMKAAAHRLADAITV